MTPLNLTPRRTGLVLWALLAFAAFASMCVLSESVRQDLHARGALLHHSEDLCPENWE